ncbi:MAG: dihydropteroate synthase [Myxococcaceae bacterium]
MTTPLARALSRDRYDDLALILARLGLPLAAQEYLAEKLPHAQVLLTDLSLDDARFLRRLCEGTDAPGREEFPQFVPGDDKRRPGAALLSGRREQIDRATQQARISGFVGLAEAIHAAGWPERSNVFKVGGASFQLGERTYVMGVINVTPDSFSDGGKFIDPSAAIAQGEALAKAGASFLDIGGESTRPGAPAVSVDEELRRVLPVLKGLRERVDVPLSIDTRKAEVAEQALAAGASLVNDITGFQGDARLAQVSAGASCCLMHIQGAPDTMQKQPHYDDVVAEVIAYLSAGAERALAAGIPRDRILIDPGIGFGKTFGHNLFLLRRLADLRVLGFPILVGTSRKAFLGHLTGGKPATQRLAATLGSVAAMAVMGGADIVRVHDVAEAQDALAVADAIRLAREGGDLWGGSVLAPTSSGP